jgi:uncharacterized protein
MSSDYRAAIAAYIREQARPPDKYSHQPRLYQLARAVGRGQEYDDDILYAAVWLHDLGVFIGHRPEDPEALSRWDNLAYVLSRAPGLLEGFGFPSEKIAAVCAAIGSHLASGQPGSIEGVILRDADILELLGAVGMLRTISKVGRDTRFHVFADALRVIRHNMETLPGQLQLPAARELAWPRVAEMRAFLASAESESYDIAL